MQRNNQLYNKTSGLLQGPTHRYKEVNLAQSIKLEHLVQGHHEHSKKTK